MEKYKIGLTQMSPLCIVNQFTSTYMHAVYWIFGIHDVLQFVNASRLQLCSNCCCSISTDEHETWFGV